MKVDHIGVAVASIAEAVQRWRPILGEPESPVPEEVPANGVRVSFLSAGSTHLELVEPTRPDSAVAKFVASRGGGIHHIAFAVRLLPILS